jgi:hypothetical protein
MEALTQANARLAKQLEDNSNELGELKALIKKERTENRYKRSFNPSPIGITHTSLTCKLPKHGHKRKPLERITWEVVKPTWSDIQGLQL